MQFVAKKLLLEIRRKREKKLTRVTPDIARFSEPVCLKRRFIPVTFLLVSLSMCGCVSIEVVGSDGVSVQKTSGVFVEINAPNASALNSKGVGGRVSSGAAFFGAFEEIAVLDSGKCRLIILDSDQTQVQNIIAALKASGVGMDGVCKKSINQGETE